MIIAYNAIDAKGNKAKSYKTVVYNVNAKGTQKVYPSMRYSKLQLKGWNIDKAVKGCIGTGKLY